MVSHSMEDVAKVADSVIVMNKGRVAMTGTLSEVFEKSEELYSMGLEIPQISRVIMKLRENGIDIKKDIYTVEDATHEITKILKG